MASPMTASSILGYNIEAYNFRSPYQSLRQQTIYDPRWTGEGLIPAKEAVLRYIATAEARSELTPGRLRELQEWCTKEDNVVPDSEIELLVDDVEDILRDHFQHPPQHLADIMALSHVDLKFLGQFARNVESDGELLGSKLFTLLGNFNMLSGMVVKARKERRLDTTRHTGSIQLYERIVWYAREALDLLETYVLPMVAKYTELKVLSYKLRASCHHLFVLFHNQPPISLKGVQVSTPPGLKSPRAKVDKGKGIDLGSPTTPERPSSVQPTHPLEGGPVGGTSYEPQKAGNADFLIPGIDYRPIALSSFQEATAIAEKVLWGSHPLRLSVKLEFAAFMYDCLHEHDRSRQLAKATIAEVYNAQEGMDDQMFEDAAQLVGLLGKMMRRGLGSGESGAGSSGTRTASPGHMRTSSQQPQVPVASPGMDNPI